MTAVATQTTKQPSSDQFEIVKMILIAAITLVLMGLATTTPSGAGTPLTPGTIAAQ